jgi:hypothetical protein
MYNSALQKACDDLKHQYCKLCHYVSRERFSSVKIKAEDIGFWFAGLAILAIGGVVAFRYFSVR